MPTAVAKSRGVKSTALKLIQNLPTQSNRDDVMYRIYVRQKIEAGLADLGAGRTHSHALERKAKA